MTAVIIRIKETKRPISGSNIGYRIVAAVRNDAGGAWAPKDRYGNKVSFGRKYLVAQSSDFTFHATARERLKGFIKAVLKLGRFDGYELLESSSQ